ncbi:MAG: hypothetical protein IPJ32_10360 [Sphingobacteriaceae bacterium]|nr:hypothetical protein [Sphingobacteriaceae bacterium]
MQLPLFRWGFSVIFLLKADFIINKSDNYDKLWKRVDSCQDKGLTESA